MPHKTLNNWLKSIPPLNLIFNVAQRDISNLKIMKKYLGIGRLQTRKDGVHYYIVSKPDDIRNKLIPFFQRYNFLSKLKKKNFAIFSEVANIMKNRKHLNGDGLLKIIMLRERINKGRGRKRKYNLHDYLNSQESSETIRQTLKKVKI